MRSVFFMRSAIFCLMLALAGLLLCAVSVAGELRSDEYRSGEYRSGEYRSGEYRSGEYRSGEKQSGDKELAALASAIVEGDSELRFLLTGYLLATEGGVPPRGHERNDACDDRRFLGASTGGILLTANMDGKEVNGIAFYQTLPRYRLFDVILADAPSGELLKIGVRRGSVYAEIGTAIVSTSGTARLTLVAPYASDPVQRPALVAVTILPPPFIPAFETGDVIEIWTEDGYFLASGWLDDNE